MRILEVPEHRVLTYLVLIQVLGVAVGWALLAFGVAIWNRVGFYGANPTAVFLRDWGFLFFLLPGLWLIFATAAKDNDFGRFEGPLIILSGIAVAIGTVIILAAIGLTSGASLIQVVD